MKDTEQIIKEDLADIEEMRTALAEEIGLPPTDRAVQCGTEAYAKMRVYDLAEILQVLHTSESFVSQQDLYQARINAILKAYPLCGA